MVHALGEEESVCQRQELGWYRGIFVPDTFKGNVSGVFYLIRDFYQVKKHFVLNRAAPCRRQSFENFLKVLKNWNGGTYERTVREDQ